MSSRLLQPAEAVQIGATCFSFAISDGRMTYFHNLQPFDFHDVADRGPMLLRAARFVESGVRRADIQAAFGISRSTLKRAVRKLRERGEASFHKPRRERGTSVITGARKARAERLLASGMGGAALARELGVPTSTVYYNLHKGFIGDGRPVDTRPEPEAAGPEALETDGTAADVREDPLDRSERDRRDREAPMGRGARDSAGRVAASAGAMAEAHPRFDEPLSAVARGLPITHKVCTASRLTSAGRCRPRH